MVLEGRSLPIHNGEEDRTTRPNQQQQKPIRLTVLERSQDADLPREHLERSLPEASLGHDLDRDGFLRHAVYPLVNLPPAKTYRRTGGT